MYRDIPRKKLLKNYLKITQKRYIFCVTDSLNLKERKFII